MVKSFFCQKLEEIASELDLMKENYSRLESISAENFEQLSVFKPIQPQKYEALSDNDAFVKPLQQYETLSHEFNQLLKEKQKKAKKLQIQENIRKKKIKEKVFEKKINSERSRWRNEKQKRKQLESSFAHEHELRKDLEYKLETEKSAHDKIFEQIDNLNYKIEQFRKAEDKQVTQLQGELKKYLSSVNKLFVDYITSQDSEKSGYEQNLQKLSSDLSKRLIGYERLEHQIKEITKEQQQTQNMISDVRQKQDYVADEIVARVIEHYEKMNQREIPPNFIESIRNIVGEPVTYELCKLKGAALGKFGCDSYHERLTRIKDLTSRLPVTDYDADIEFLKLYELALRKSFESGDIRNAMQYQNLNKTLVKETLNSVQDYVVRCVTKKEEIYKHVKDGALLSA